MVGACFDQMVSKTFGEQNSANKYRQIAARPKPNSWAAPRLETELFWVDPWDFTEKKDCIHTDLGESSARRKSLAT